uniref:Uncharacterized protein n=1 Tax=Avena sativa TaxID=4498 RepID=A0ACD5V925_AVESA
MSSANAEQSSGATEPSSGGAVEQTIRDAEDEVDAEAKQPLGYCDWASATWDFVSPILEFFLPITLTYLVLSLILRPSHVRPRVDAAELIRFNLANATSTLHYDIAVDLSIRNWHKHLSARYLDLTAVAWYGGARLGTTVHTLPLFIQRPKSSKVVHAVFRGRAAHLDPAVAEVFGRDAADGSFGVRVTVSSTFMYTILFEKPVYYYRHECDIRFPVLRNGTPSTALLSATDSVCNATDR